MPDYEYAVLYENLPSAGPEPTRVRVHRREHAEKIVATDAAHGERSVVQRRQIGDWETVPAETSAEGERQQMACPMTHLPEMPCGACGKPVEVQRRA